jgi:hypothetical protein
MQTQGSDKTMRPLLPSGRTADSDVTTRAPPCDVRLNTAVATYDAPDLRGSSTGIEIGRSVTDSTTSFWSTMGVSSVFTVMSIERNDMAHWVPIPSTIVTSLGGITTDP